MQERHLTRVLVVDDDASLRRSLAESLEDDKTQVTACCGAQLAIETLAQVTPDVVVLDVALSDGDAFDVLRVILEHKPTPAVVAISGTATPDQSFHLAELGVSTYLAKPFGIEELRRAIDRALAEPPDLGPLLRHSVGQRTLRDVEIEVRSTMLEEAMARAEGSRRGAARLLDVSRQLVQRMLRLRR